MLQITVTLDFTAKALEAIAALTETLNRFSNKTITANAQINSISAPTPETKSIPTQEKQVKTPTEETTKTETPAISLADVRAVALKLSKAGRQDILKQLFTKYNAEKLSDISEDDYPALMADLECANE